MNTPHMSEPSSRMLIALDDLQPHPLNANIMPEATLAKLAAHIRETGLYPPLIVRRLPSTAAHEHAASSPTRYQILDGHHRALALRSLGCDSALCEVWNVDDHRAALLLATLNRLRGEDDPHLRATLLASLAAEHDVEALLALLPEDRDHLQSMLALAQQPPEDIPDECDLAPLPRALTFFLDEADHRRIVQQLKAIDADRNVAIVRALAGPKATSPPETGGDA